MSHGKRPEPPVEVQCITCGRLFLRHVCHIPANGRVFCSRECQWQSYIGGRASDATRQKMSLAQSGEKSNTWKGGISRQYKRGYRAEQFKRWRLSVFKRDRYNCRGCGQHGGYLTAHHIKSFAEYPDLRYDVSNGITLCEECHSQQDNYYRRLHPRPQKGG